MGMRGQWQRTGRHDFSGRCSYLRRLAVQCCPVLRRPPPVPAPSRRAESPLQRLAASGWLFGGPFGVFCAPCTLLAAVPGVPSRRPVLCRAPPALAVVVSRLDMTWGRVSEGGFPVSSEGSVANLVKGRCVIRRASCSPHDSALARRSCSNATASVRAHGPRPKARSTIRASPTMQPWKLKIPAWPLRSARITSKPLIVA